MKKIEFGFNNDLQPKGSWEGIGIRPGLLLTEADYYGAIMYDGESYIVAKVTKDQYNRHPQLLNKFIVRQAIADMYPDGSGVLFLDQEETPITEYLENCFNEPKAKKEISSVNDLFGHCLGTCRANIAFKFLTLTDNFIAVSIKHDVFERKNDALKGCSSSFSELQEKLSTFKQNHRR